MNITLRISDKLGNQAKHLAIDEGTMLSGLVTTMLKERLNDHHDTTFRKACDEAWELMNHGVEGDGKKFDRESLYDRVK